MKHGIIVSGENLSFSASHFIVEHAKCERLHGHNYLVKAEFEGRLDEKGMIADFRLIKDTVSAICEQLDHRIIIPKNSKHVKIEKKGENLRIKAGKKLYSFPQRDCILIPTESSTAEQLAEFVFNEIKKELKKTKIKIVRASVAESNTSEAFYKE